MEQLKELREGENMHEESFEANLRQGDAELINSIPDFYFSDKFQLDNPRTFHKVLDAIDLFLTKLDMKRQAERDEAFSELRDRLNDFGYRRNITGYRDIQILTQIFSCAK